MITILGELYSSKNSRQIYHVGDRNIIAKSDKSKGQERSLTLQLKTKRAEWLRMRSNYPVLQPLRVAFKIYRRTHQRFDYTNIIQGLLDAMVEAQLIQDDNADCIIPIFHPFKIDMKNPRVEISLVVLQVIDEI